MYNHMLPLSISTWVSHCKVCDDSLHVFHWTFHKAAHRTMGRHRFGMGRPCHAKLHVQPEANCRKITTDGLERCERLLHGTGGELLHIDGRAASRAHDTNLESHPFKSKKNTQVQSRIASSRKQKNQPLPAEAGRG